MTGLENTGALAWYHVCSWLHNLFLSGVPSHWIPSRGRIACEITLGEVFNKTENSTSPNITGRWASSSGKILISNYTKQSISILKHFNTKATGSTKDCWKLCTLPFHIYQQLEQLCGVDRVSQKQDLEDATSFFKPGFLSHATSVIMVCLSSPSHSTVCQPNLREEWSQLWSYKAFFKFLESQLAEEKLVLSQMKGSLPKPNCHLFCWTASWPTTFKPWNQPQLFLALTQLKIRGCQCSWT